MSTWNCIASVVLFSLVALLSFSLWAFGAPLFPSEPALYSACAAVFLALGGLALLPGAGLPARARPRFCIAFATAFLAYAFCWSGTWFLVPDTFGETWGAALGLFVFALILKTILRLSLSLFVGTAILFLCHSLGYYTGDLFHDALRNRGPLGVDLALPSDTIRYLARLGWGLAYGAGLGAGVLAYLSDAETRSESPSTHI